MPARPIFRLGAALLAPMLALSGCNAPPPHAGQRTVQGQSMTRMLATVEALRAYARGEGGRPEAEQAAAELVAWSGRMGELFPPAEAARYVDMSPEMARGAPAAMQDTSRRLLDATRTGSRQAVGGQLARTEREGCGACHLRPYG